MKEQRINENSQFSIRSNGNGERVVEGYASVFGQESRLIAENGKVFYEIIEQGAFDEALARDDLNVIANRDHDDMKMLARTKSGTLALSVNETGLLYTFQPPNTVLGNDTVELINRGDLSESSFRYNVKQDGVEWSYGDDGILRRRVFKVFKIFDVAIVVNGAFANTDISMRGTNFEEIENELKERELKRQQELDAYYKQLTNGIL